MSAPDQPPFRRMLIQTMRLATASRPQDLANRNPLIWRLLELGQLREDRPRREFLLDNPVFLSMSVVQYVLQLPPELGGRAYQRLLPEFGVFVEETPVGHMLRTDDSKYPVGSGPIEKLWDGAESGQRTCDDAVLDAKDPALASRLSPIYVSALSAANTRLASTAPLVAAARQRILVEVTESIDEKRSFFDRADAWKIRAWAGVPWLEIAAAALREIPDGRMFVHARALGEALIEESQSRGDELILGRILDRMGILHIRPYVSGRSSAHFNQEMRQWRAGLREQLGDSALEIEARFPMPRPREALETAVAFLRRACEHRSGALRGVSLSHLAEALMWLRVTGGHSDDAEIRATAEEALSLLEDDNDAAARARQVLSGLEALNRILSVRLSELPFREMAPEADDDEHAHVTEWWAQLDALLESEDAATRPLREIVAPVVSRLVSNQAGDGLRILEGSDAKKLARDLGYEAPIGWLRSVLLMNDAADWFDREEYERAVRANLRAIENLAPMHLEGHVVACLHRLADLARPDVIADLVNGLYEAALTLELYVSIRCLRVVQFLCRKVAGLALHAGAPRDHVFVLWQIAKGLRFATTSNRGIAELWRVDGPDRRTLDPLFQRLALEPDEREWAAPDELSLFTYASQPGGTPSEAAPEDAVRQQIDQTFEHLFIEAALLSRSLPNEILPLLTIAQVQELLDAETVLALFYIGRSQRDTIAIHLLLMTREHEFVAEIAQDLPDSVVQTSEGIAHPLAFFLANLRTEIQKSPPSGAVATRKALDDLEACRDMLFSGAVQYLEEFFMQGKRHLCIVPHGPLHLVPFHLIAESGGPLAERWCVTYLPNLNLLGLEGRRPRSRFERHEGVTAFAVDSVMVRGLPDLPEAVDEANAIAGVFGRQAVVNEAFTRERFCAELLTGCRYIHIATHGEMDVAAPCFHHFFLGPREGIAQRFYAFQLVSLDLRGIDLLTLSACETALGRFDIGDNLRGLPAYFLLAGVSAIAATLWEVETNAAQTFFTALYESLEQDGDRLEAFKNAQRITRERHPEYRDWGAFCYVGDWSVGTFRSSEWSLPGIPGLRFGRG